MYDVAIVGYGPVGATLANLLARYGLRIAILDQAADIYDKPRAITLDHEVLRVFQSCGLSDEIEKRTAPHPGTHYLGVHGDVIKVFDPLPPPYPLGWVPTATFVQPEFEKLLRDKLAAYPKADVLLATRAVSFNEDPDGVSLTIEPAAGGASRTLQARYLVACDGANSFVRKRLGVALDDLAFDEWWMVVDAFTSDVSKRPAKCFQYCRPSRPGTYLPGPGTLRRWEIKLLPGEDPVEFGKPDNVAKVLQDFTDTSDLEIWRSAVYRFHALLAQSWQSGRIFMMGDAAHQTPPFLGQGLCAGIRDAVNLAWKLAMVLDRRAAPALLESYELERKPHVAAIVAAAKEFGLIIGELDTAAAEARDARLIAELRSGKAETVRQKFIPNLQSGVIASGAPTAGTLFVQPFVQRGYASIARLDDVLAPGFAIVAASAAIFADMAPASLKTWQSLGGECVMVRSLADVSANDAPSGVQVWTEAETLLSDWLRREGVEAVIVRPDRYVFGGARTAADLDALVAALERQLQLN